MAFVCVLMLGLTPLFLVVAVAVRTATRVSPLSNLDYQRVANPEALHRRIGNRLFALPTASLLFGLLGLIDPARTGIYIACFAVVFSLCVVYIIYTTANAQ
jgi:hypothetical protein